MLIETRSPAKVGQVLRFTLGSHSLEGEIAWQDGALCGVTFNRPLETQIWEMVSCQPLAVTMPRQFRHDRPAGNNDEDVEVSPRTIGFARGGPAR